MTGNSITNVFNDTITGRMVVCVQNDRTVGSLGVWIGDNPFDFVLPVTLCQIFLIGLISRVIHYILRPIHTPKFICSLIAGILLGPTMLGHGGAIRGALFPLKQSLFLNTMSKIATAYSVFIISLKTDILVALRGAQRCWRFGVFPFLASFMVTVTLFFMYMPPATSVHESDKTSLYTFPNIFTLSSLTVVTDTLTELNLISTELGQIAISSSMISEILQWGIVEFQFNLKVLDLNFSIVHWLNVIVLLAITFLVARPLVMIAIKRTPPGKPMKEEYVVMILLGPLIMAAVSDFLGVYFVLGPLIYGLVLPNGPPLATIVIEKSEFLIHEFLMPFFFLYTGKRTDLNEVNNNGKLVLVIQSILYVGFFVKLLVCVLIAPTHKVKPKHGVVLGLILNVKGVVEIIFYTRMLKLKAIDTETFSVAVIYVVTSTSICIPLIKLLYRHRRVCDVPTINEGCVRTIQNITENSGLNIISCVHTDAHVHSMIALIEACNPTLLSPICIYVIHLIELFGKSTPILLPMKKNNRKSWSVNYPNTNHILRAFENYSNNSTGPVTILSYINVAPYKSMHEAICNLAEDSSVHLLIIPFHQNDPTISSHMVSKFRNLNSSFLTKATCTVGILVDKYSSLSVSSTKCSFHVGIFFIGGKDDREALALGIRMLERPNTSVTLFRFIILSKKEDSGFVKDTFKGNNEGELESVLDESLIDEFKANNIITSDSINVIYHEVAVEDCIHVLEEIRKMENDYDLVMVGKGHNIKGLKEEEMSNFIDNADQLGIFGDMLASNEFCNGKTPVLVMQCGKEKQVKHLENVGPSHVFPGLIL